MSLHNYSNAARTIAEELQEELHAECFETLVLPTTVRSVSVAFLNSQGRYRPQAIRLIGLSPSQREAFLAKLDLESRFWILAVATDLATRSAELLDAVDIHLQPGGPYRTKVRSAADIVADLWGVSLAWWPFGKLERDL